MVYKLGNGISSSPKTQRECLMQRHNLMKSQLKAHCGLETEEKGMFYVQKHLV